MPIEIQITDLATPMLRRVQMVLGRRQLNAAVGTAVVRLVQDNFQQLPPNKKGWPSTHYWGQAAKQTHFEISDTDVRVIVSQAGIKMHATGQPSEIVPVNVKKLTIPAVPEAYGRRAREFTNLRIMYSKKSGVLKAVALVQDEGGLLVRKAGGGSRRLTGTVKQTGRVIFWLVDRVQTKKYEGVMPSEDEIRKAAVDAVKQRVARARKQMGESDQSDADSTSNS